MIGIALAGRPPSLSHTAVSSCPSQKITSGRGRGLLPPPIPPVPPLQLAATPLHLLPSSVSAAADWGCHVGSSGNSQLALEGVPLPLEVDLVRGMGTFNGTKLLLY